MLLKVWVRILKYNLILKWILNLKEKDLMKYLKP